MPLGHQLDPTCHGLFLSGEACVELKPIIQILTIGVLFFFVGPTRSLASCFTSKAEDNQAGTFAKRSINNGSSMRNQLIATCGEQHDPA